MRLFITGALHNRGGFHSACGLLAIAWLSFDSVAWLQDGACTTSYACMLMQVVCTLRWTLLALLLTVCVAAIPCIRRRQHNLFEYAHRYAGWTAVIALWSLDWMQRK